MTNEYIKMVLTLPDEFFKGWKYNDGDLFLYIPDVENAPPEGYQIFTISFGVLCFSGWWHDVDSWIVASDVSLKDGRPIPSQEQLQKMLIYFENKDSKYKHSNYFTISKRFIAVVIEGDLVSDMELKTLNEMWLEFVVYLMYALVWNGESWEKMV